MVQMSLIQTEQGFAESEVELNRKPGSNRFAGLSLKPVKCRREKNERNGPLCCWVEEDE